MSSLFLQYWPQSIFDPFVVTSPRTPRYNCIAWAFEDENKFYWPDPSKLYFWPSSIPREETIDAFIKLYELKGYTICHDEQLEIGFGKIAIYASNEGKPTHAARQLSGEIWTSKLGPQEDVSHSLAAMQGGAYGNVAVFMKRKL